MSPWASPIRGNAARALPLLRGVARPSPLAKQQQALSWRRFNELRVRVPARVAFCVRRKQRREVMHALGIAGRRGLGRGGVRRRESSQWAC